MDNAVPFFRFSHRPISYLFAQMGPCHSRPLQLWSSADNESKLLERVVARQLTTYLNTASLIPARQSAYRQHHCTALLKICNDSLMAADKGMVTLVVLLDYSAHFDTVDHSIMLQILEKLCGLSGSALQWHTTYLQSRTCAVVAGGVSSDTVQLECSLPQGSSLGPLKFIIYAAELHECIDSSTR